MTTEFIPASDGGPAGGGPRPLRFSGPAGDGDRHEVSILIVEDEWLVSMEIEASVEDAGYRVVGVAASAEEAVRLAEMYMPTLVLMDIRLRGAGDGVQAAIEIRRRFGIRSLFVSSHSDSATRERAEASEPVGWLSKPFSSQQLALAIAAGLPNGQGR